MHLSSIRPGVNAVQSPDDMTSEKKNVTTADTLMDLVRNLFPENIIQVRTHLGLFVKLRHTIFKVFLLPYITHLYAVLGPFP